MSPSKVGFLSSTRGERCQEKMGVDRHGFILCGTESTKNNPIWYKTYAIGWFVLIPTYKKCYAGAIFELNFGEQRHITEVLITVQYSAANHNTTQHNNTHNNKMRHCRPTLQRLCPFSPWVWWRRQQLMAPPLPMVPCKAHAMGLGGTTGGSPVWGANASTIKKLRGRWGLGLRWPSFDDATQQST